MTKETWWLVIGFIAFFALTAIFGGGGKEVDDINCFGSGYNKICD
tara:strand:- start:21171 stop:21305 length:135 start_codon:yes stop_codon:yes gene_type:complete